MLLVAARLPQSPQGFAEAARVTGLAVADVRARLAGPLPRVLHVEADAERASALAAELERMGFGIIACDPRAASGDEDRLQARAVRFAEVGAGGEVGPGGGERIVVLADAEPEPGARAGQAEVPLERLTLIQRGVRSTTATTVTTKEGRKLALGRALLSGGLMLTRKVETKTTITSTAQEGFLLLHRGDGEPDVMIRERRIDYRFLGNELQPSSAGNFQRLTARLRTAAPGVPFDDRLSRPGLVSALPVSPALALDVALWLVHLVHLRGFGAG